MRDYEEKSYYEIQLDNKQLILVFLAGMTVCVLIFILGVMVGKGKKEAEMAALKTEATSTATTATQPDLNPPQEIQPVKDDSGQARKDRKNRKLDRDKTEEKTGEEYSFYNLDKSEAAQPEVKQPGEAKPVKTQKVEPKKAETKTEKAVAEKTVAPGKEEPKNQEVKETTAVEPPADSTMEPVIEAASGRYTVQVMATSSKNKADEELQLLKSKGYTAFLDEFNNAGGSVFKVRVGKFSDAESAKKMASRIKQDLKLETWVAVLD
jgi:cell division septation protein DedD